MSYLLDTNACIALMNGEPTAVRGNFERAVRRKLQIYISSIVAFELWYGIAKSTRVEKNIPRFDTLLSSSILLLPFDNEDSRVAGTIRAALETVGEPVGAYDYLIAGQALARDLTLVTANVAEFSRVNGLLWQDWAKP